MMDTPDCFISKIAEEGQVPGVSPPWMHQWFYVPPLPTPLDINARILPPPLKFATHAVYKLCFPAFQTLRFVKKKQIQALRCAGIEITSSVGNTAMASDRTFGQYNAFRSPSSEDLGRVRLCLITRRTIGNPPVALHTVLSPR